MPSWSSLRALSAVAAALCLTGCAAVRSYDAELSSTLDYARSGNVQAAIRTLQSNNRFSDKDLLYYLELGMLERLASRYRESQKAWMAASLQVQARSALAEAASLLGRGASYVLNDKMRAYEGHDYEKVMLLTYVALNHLALGDYNSARVAIKQTHELEAMIAETRSRQYAEVEEEAKKRGARTSFKELAGYPVQTIDNPAVNALKNSYQSALSHYLAGFIYESLGEASLAAPGYRLANELQPGVPLLEEALRGLDARVAASADGKTDVLFLVASGTAPALRSQQFSLLVPVQGRGVLVAVPFPIMVRTGWTPPPSALAVDGAAALPLASLASIELMARRSLKDDMPAIMLRAATRAATSAALQYQAQRSADRHDSAALVAAIIGIGSAMLATADDRTWRALPSEISIARARLPAGAHSVTLETPEGPRSATVQVSGRYAVIDLWLLGGQLYARDPATQKRESSR